MAIPHPLSRNRGRYLGETLDIDAVQRETLAAAITHHWRVEPFLDQADVQLVGLCRPVPEPRRRAYVSAGIHGDEPAGPLALLELLAENVWPVDCELWLCPCLNPSGFRGNTRENASGRDLNRDYLHVTSPEVRAHINLLKSWPAFDLTICLHEDWEAKGFYLYELNETNLPSFAETVVAEVARVCPIDPSLDIDGRPARQGIIRPSADPRSRPEWPEAFYLFQHHAKLGMTLEAPSDFALAVRVAALKAAVRAAMASLPARP